MNPSLLRSFGNAKRHEVTPLILLQFPFFARPEEPAGTDENPAHQRFMSAELFIGRSSLEVAGATFAARRSLSPGVCGRNPLHSLTLSPRSCFFAPPAFFCPPMHSAFRAACSSSSTLFFSSPPTAYLGTSTLDLLVFYRCSCKCLKSNAKSAARSAEPAKRPRATVDSVRLWSDSAFVQDLNTRRMNCKFNFSVP